jgi:hypothetical protein
MPYTNCNLCKVEKSRIQIKEDYELWELWHQLCAFITSGSDLKKSKSVAFFCTMFSYYKYINSDVVAESPGPVMRGSVCRTVNCSASAVRDAERAYVIQLIFYK